MDWTEAAYVFGIPLGTFGLDLLMRRLIKHERLELAEWSYGVDLGLTAITTGVACLRELKNPDWDAVSVVLFIALFFWIWAMVLEQIHEGSLNNLSIRHRWAARIMLLGVGNLFGLFPMVAVLWLMFKQ